MPVWRVNVKYVLNVNWSDIVKGILPTLQSHDWNNGTHGGQQLDSGDLYLLLLAVWPSSVLLATVWESWMLMECPKEWFLHPPSPHTHPPTHPSPSHPTQPHRPSHPTPPPIPPTPSIINNDSRKGRKKYLEIWPSEIEKVSYNKNQQITMYFAAQHVSTIQDRGLVFVTEYFKSVFLKIPLGAN